MPVIDMSVAELKKYNGVNPRPADFDEYWEKAIAEMKATDANAEFIPVDMKAPGIECYDFYFTGVNGARIHCRHTRPANIKGKIPAVLVFHGYTGNCGEWTTQFHFSMAGMAVFAMDVRGQGGKSEDVGGVVGNTHHGHIIRGLDCEDPHKLLFRDIFLDTAQLAGLVMDMDFIDETKVYAKGGSQGGALTIACASLEPRIAKAFPVFPFLCDYKRVWDMDLDVGAYIELREYFRHFDPRHEREEEIFTKLGYIDLQFLAPRIKAKLTMATGLMDTICPPSTQFAAFNKMTCEKKVIFYPDFGHEGLPDLEDTTFKFLLED